MRLGAVPPAYPRTLPFSNEGGQTSTAATGAAVAAVPVTVAAVMAEMGAAVEVATGTAAAATGAAVAVASGSAIAAMIRLV